MTIGRFFAVSILLGGLFNVKSFWPVVSKTQLVLLTVTQVFFLSDELRGFNTSNESTASRYKKKLPRTGSLMQTC